MSATAKAADAPAPAPDFAFVRGETHLLRPSAGKGKAARFAAGKSRIEAYSVGAAGDVVVARADALELWEADGTRRWRSAGAFLCASLAKSHVVAVGTDGALVVAAREDGELLGAIRLASTEATETWRLAHASGAIVVLALGDWLVWVDAGTRKVVRRVRARAKVVELRADADLVVAALEEGHIQTFRAQTGDPRASFVAHESGIRDLRLSADGLVTFGVDGESKPWERGSLDKTAVVASPITSIAARGDLSACGDRAGHVRVARGGRDVGSLMVGEPILGLHVADADVVIAATSKVAMRAVEPWDKPRPIVLKAPPTAFAADEGYAFVGTQTGAVDVYDLTAGRHLTSYALSSDDRVTAIARLPGALLVVGTGALDGRVIVVDVIEAKVKERLELHDEAFGVTALASDPRGRIVASGSDDGSVCLVDPKTGRLLARLRVAETPISMAFDATGRSLAVVFADGTASVVAFGPKGAQITDTGLRGVARVAWPSSAGEGALFGFADGRIEPHTRSRSTPPSA